MIPAFRAIVATADVVVDVLNRSTRAIEATLRSIEKIEILGGVLITSVAVSTTPVAIAHKLGRRPRGWVVVDDNTGVIVWRTASDAQFLTLDASASATISLWVF